MSGEHTPHPGDIIKEGDWFVIAGWNGVRLDAFCATKVTAKQVRAPGTYSHHRSFSRCQIVAVLPDQAAAEALVEAAAGIEGERNRRHREADLAARNELAAAISEARS